MLSLDSYTAPTGVSRLADRGPAPQYNDGSGGCDGSDHAWTPVDRRRRPVSATWTPVGRERHVPDSRPSQVPTPSTSSTTRTRSARVTTLSRRRSLLTSWTSRPPRRRPADDWAPAVTAHPAARPSARRSSTTVDARAGCHWSTPAARQRASASSVARSRPGRCRLHVRAGRRDSPTVDSPLARRSRPRRLATLSLTRRHGSPARYSTAKFDRDGTAPHDARSGRRPLRSTDSRAAVASRHECGRARTSARRHHSATVKTDDRLLHRRRPRTPARRWPDDVVVHAGARARTRRASPPTVRLVRRSG